METHDMEMQVPEPKLRNRKVPVFDRLTREEYAVVPENSINTYMAPSTSSQSSHSRQTSGNLPMKLSFLCCSYSSAYNECMKLIVCMLSTCTIF